MYTHIIWPILYSILYTNPSNAYPSGAIDQIICDHHLLHDIHVWRHQDRLWSLIIAIKVPILFGPSGEHGVFTLKYRTNQITSILQWMVFTEFLDNDIWTTCLIKYYYMHLCLYRYPNICVIVGVQLLYWLCICVIVGCFIDCVCRFYIIVVWDI